jgi:branched-chain amino acid transport system substrate-binding protein
MAITSKYKITALIAAIAVVVVGVLWIGGKRQGEEHVIKIGAILPLTGTASDIGEWCQKGIEVAVSEINQPGAVYQQRLQVLFEDSRNDPKTGLSALNKLTSLDKVPIVIVAMSSVASAILPAADQNNAVVFATVVSLPRFTQRSEWAFRYHISGDSEAKAMSTFARKELGLKKLAVLYIDDEFGRSTYAELENAFRIGGGDLIFAEGFSKDVQDYRSLIAKVKQQGPEGVYVVGYDKAYATILKQLGESGISAKILTNSGLEIPA